MADNTSSIDSVSVADAVFDFETRTFLLVLIPVCSVIACMCSVACMAWYCGRCPSVFNKCPSPLRKCLVYEEEQEDKTSEAHKKTAEFDVNAARESLLARGAWILDVLIIRAQNLPRLDWAINDRNLVGTSDPFVKLKVVDDKADAGKWRRSKVKRGTLHPDFSENFRFHLHEQSITLNAKLKLEVWDWDRWKPNDFSGHAEVSLSSQLTHATESTPAEDFMWVDLGWRDGSAVLGGSEGNLRAQLQLRVRAVRTRRAEEVLRDEEAGRSRLREGLLGGPEARLEGLNLVGTRRGVLRVEPEMVLDPRLREAVQARDKAGIGGLLAGEGAGLDRDDVRVARQQLRVIAAEEAASTAAVRRDAARRGLGLWGGSDGEEEDSEGGEGGGRGPGAGGEERSEREHLVELAGQFARGEVSKEAFLEAKAALGRRFGRRDAGGAAQGAGGGGSAASRGAQGARRGVDPRSMRIGIGGGEDSPPHSEAASALSLPSGAAGQPRPWSDEGGGGGGAGRASGVQGGGIAAGGILRQQGERLQHQGGELSVHQAGASELSDGGGGAWGRGGALRGAGAPPPQRGGGGGLLSDRKEFGGRGRSRSQAGTPAGLPVTVGGPSRSPSGRAGAASSGGIMMGGGEPPGRSEGGRGKGVTFAPGVSGSAPAPREVARGVARGVGAAGASAGGGGLGSVDAAAGGGVGGPLRALGGSLRWHGGYGAGTMVNGVYVSASGRGGGSRAEESEKAATEAAAPTGPAQARKVAQRLPHGSGQRFPAQR